jgi:vacuolar-type H+-ATPase subunit H
MDGLDDDMASFINSLIDQNSELVNKLEHVDSLRELADRTVLEARKEAENIKTEAEEKAAKIVTWAEEKAKAAAHKIVNKAKEKAQAEAEKIIAGAKEDASRIIAEAKKAEGGAKIAVPETVQEPAADRKAKQTEAAKKPHGDGAKPVVEAERDRKAIEKVEPIVCSQENVKTVKPEETAVQKDSGKEPPFLYQDMVELTLPPPIPLDHMLKLHKQLKNTPNVKVMELTGSLDKGVAIKLFLMAPTPLADIIKAIPEVEKVTEGLHEKKPVHAGRQKDSEPTPHTIVIKMKK